MTDASIGSGWLNSSICGVLSPATTCAAVMMNATPSSILTTKPAPVLTLPSTLVDSIRTTPLLKSLSSAACARAVSAAMQTRKTSATVRPIGLACVSCNASLNAACFPARIIAGMTGTTKCDRGRMDGTLTCWIESARSSNNRRRRTIQRRPNRSTHVAGAQGKAPGVVLRMIRLQRCQRTGISAAHNFTAFSFHIPDMRVKICALSARV